MQEVFEKIIEKLEVAGKTELIVNGGRCNGKTLALGYAKGISDSIEIVKQEAEKFGHDTNVGSNGWIPCSERLPEDDKKQYIVQKTNGFLYILGFTKDAYKLDRYDFAEYKGKKKQLFYDYDSEYGYTECECEAWQPMPEPFKERD